MNNHLTPQQMLGHIDGELSKSETRRADEHLHSCWTCLTEVERLKSDIAAILDAQNEGFDPALPPPPQPWPSFHSVIARSLPDQPVSLWLRFRAYLHNFLKPVRVMAVSGIVAVLLVSGYAIFRSKPVSAQEVLRRMQVADTRRSAITKDQVIRERVHIRKTTHGQSHPKLATVDSWKSSTAAYWNVSEGDSAAADLRAQYQAHKVPVDLPLSAASVDAWGKAAGNSPTASRQGSDVDLSFARAADGPAGSVQRVSLTVQSDTWQIRQMTLDFPDASFEVTEDDYAVMSTNDVPADLLARLQPENTPSSLTTSRIPGPSLNSIHSAARNLDEAELEAFSTLHSLKADLGEPVILTRSSQVVTVGLWQLPPERQSELRAALSDKQGIRIELTAPRVPLNSRVRAVVETQPPMANGAPLRVETESGHEDERLFKYFGSAEREQDFSNEAVGTSAAILSHLYALRTLQQEFPANRSHPLAPEEEVRLRSLVRDHVTAISASVDALSRQLAPLNATFGLSPCALSSTAAAMNWQGEALKALNTAKEIDHLLRALLTTSREPVVPDSALPAINQDICHLRWTLTGISGAKS